MSEFISLCPKCRQRILCDTQYMGTRVACPLCLQEIVMPAPPAESRPGATAPGFAHRHPAAARKKNMPLVVVVIAAAVLVLAAAATIWYFNGAKHAPSLATKPAVRAAPAPPAAPAVPAAPGVPAARPAVPPSAQPVAAPVAVPPARPLPPVRPTSADAAQALRAWWTFDQDGGTLVSDHSGNGYHATLVGSRAHWTQAARGGSGALSLGGASYAETEGPVVDTTKSFTVTAWVYVNAIEKGSFSTFVSLDGAVVSGFYLQLNSWARDRFVFNRLESDDHAASTIMAKATFDTELHTWYHLAGVYDADAATLSLYVNGTLQQTVAFTTPWQATGRTAIGRGFYRGNKVDFIKGMVADVRIYASALKPEAIQALATK
jgi:hypothetical protein